MSATAPPQPVTEATTGWDDGAIEYEVRWEIELEAGSPQEAAAIALAIHRDPFSQATHFQVRPRGGDLPWVSVDVGNPEVM